MLLVGWPSRPIPTTCVRARTSIWRALSCATAMTCMCCCPPIDATKLVGANLGYAYTQIPTLSKLLVDKATAETTAYDRIVVNQRYGQAARPRRQGKHRRDRTPALSRSVDAGVPRKDKKMNVNQTWKTSTSFGPVLAGRKILIVVEKSACPVRSAVLAGSAHIAEIRRAGFHNLSDGEGVYRALPVARRYSYLSPSHATRGRRCSGYLLENSAALFWETVLSWKILFKHGFDTIQAAIRRI